MDDMAIGLGKEAVYALSRAFGYEPEIEGPDGEWNPNPEAPLPFLARQVRRLREQKQGRWYRLWQGRA